MGSETISAELIPASPAAGVVHEALVEALDPRAMTELLLLDLPTYKGEFGWPVLQVHTFTPLRKALIVFVVASDESASSVARRVARYRALGQAAIGVCRINATDATRPVNGVLRLSQARWARDVRKLLTAVTSVAFERQPEAVVCIDWQDLTELLNLPGELFLEWSQRANEDAVRTVCERMKARISGRKCRGMFIRLGGGRNRWFKELRAASNACHEMMGEGGTLLGGDSTATFRGRPGCFLLAIAE